MNEAKLDDLEKRLTTLQDDIKKMSILIYRMAMVIDDLREQGGQEPFEWTRDIV